MPKQTLNYKLGYFVAGEFTDTTTEANRWNTIDIQLRGLYEALGNGVLEGWDIRQSGNLNVEILPGRGIVAFVSCASYKARSLTLAPNTTSYIYASLTADSYWTQNVTFSVFFVKNEQENAIYIGTVTTNETQITNIYTQDRTSVGLYDAVSNLIAQHKHIGGSDNPSQIDLETEVQGKIGQDSIGDLDASIIKSGVLDSSVIPQIDHNTLKNKGTLTHAQLDSLSEFLNVPDNNLMGETVLINFLQLILALKHQWPEIDEYLVNELAFIPGISPNSIIDTEHTTAYVDTKTAQEGGEHTISGYPGPSTEIFTKTFNTQSELEKALKYRVNVVGDSLVLATTGTKVFVEDFENVSDWQTRIMDLSSNSGIFVRDAETFIQGQYSGKIDLNVDTEINVAFVLEKIFNPQDWSKYNRIVFYLKTEGVEHGDLYFYLNDTVYGSQNSFTMVLERGTPTINRDTLMVGWREISVDISKYQRSGVVSIGFYTSTRSGWKASRPLTLNIDNMYLTKNNEFVENGYARFIYGDELYKNFWRVRWDALLPTGSVLKVRTRLANDVSLFDDNNPNHAVWSAYSTTSGFTINNPTGELYKYIQIETFFQSSVDKQYSPILKRLFLDTYVSSDEAKFTYNSKENWKTGTLVNADIDTQPGKILIKNISEINNIICGYQNKIIKTDKNYTPILEIAGTALPKSTNQVLNNSISGFGQISAIEKGGNDVFWIADTDNDRVVCVDTSGKLICGFYGSFLNEPCDPYGNEEKGPGSNVDCDACDNVSITSNQLTVLHAIYNPNTYQLNIIFNRPIAPINTTANQLDFNKIFLKADSFRFYFNSNTSTNLFGIDNKKYDLWTNSTNPFLKQFNFLSHVLQLSLSQADAVTLASVINFYIPSLICITPTQNKMIFNNHINLNFLVNNAILGDNYQIRIQVDNGVYNYYTSTNILLTNLTEGYHNVEAVLVDHNNNPLEYQEALTHIKFIVDLSDLKNQPRIEINSPKQNQIFSSPTIQIEFSVYNFPILPVGNHIRYSINGGLWREHRSLDPIVINSCSTGYHYIDIYLADEEGQQIPYDYSRTFIECFVGVSSLSSFKLIMDNNAIKALPNPQKENENLNNLEVSIPIDVGNIYISNIYSPVDVSYIPNEISLFNPDGQETILVAKLRSPSTMYCLNSTNRSTTELITTPSEDNSIIFNNKYLMDGHSVIQLACNNGNLLFSNNAAKFADNRQNAKKMLGSVRKIAYNKLLIADSIRQRAIMTVTDFITQNSFVYWEYLSPRYIVDAQPIKVETKEISVKETICTPDQLTVAQNTTVIWTNNSLSNIQIYSGYTTLQEFAQDPDLTLYGDDFVSQTLKPGEQFSFTFNNLGTFYWFAYPNIVTGVIYVAATSISNEDQYLLVENDLTNSSFGSRIIKINSWGKVVWSFGEGYLVNPKDVRCIPDESSIIIST